MNPEKCWLQTYTGKRIFPLDPDPEQIDIRDIAHALANQCRFAGHTKRFYSVAEHSYHVSFMLGTVPALALWGLLHDASEAYLVDLPSPLKRDSGLGRLYADYERVLMRAVCIRFGLPEEMPASVHSADRAVLASEANTLMTGVIGDWGLDSSEGNVAIFGLNPEDAEDLFLRKFESLTRASVRKGVGGVASQVKEI